jgi:hypothetical protein
MAKKEVKPMRPFKTFVVLDEKGRVVEIQEKGTQKREIWYDKDLGESVVRVEVTEV